jgi:hypothetical protein
MAAGDFGDVEGMHPALTGFSDAWTHGLCEAAAAQDTSRGSMFAQIRRALFAPAEAAAIERTATVATANAIGRFVGFGHEREAASLPTEHFIPASVFINETTAVGPGLLTGDFAGTPCAALVTTLRDRSEQQARRSGVSRPPSSGLWIQMDTRKAVSRLIVAVAASKPLVGRTVIWRDRPTPESRTTLKPFLSPMADAVPLALPEVAADDGYSGATTAPDEAAALLRDNWLEGLFAFQDSGANALWYAQMSDRDRRKMATLQAKAREGNPLARMGARLAGMKLVTEAWFAGSVLAVALGGLRWRPFRNEPGRATEPETVRRVLCEVGIVLAVRDALLHADRQLAAGAA